MHNRFKPIVALMLLVAATTATHAADLSENFSTWPLTGNSASNFSYAGWTAVSVLSKGENFSPAVNGAIWFPATNTPSLTTPLLTNGFGRISFDSSARATNAFPFLLRMSTNSAGPWTQVAAFTNRAPSGTWTNWTFSTNEYRDVYLQLEGGNPGGGLFLGLDNVRITEAAAKVEFGTPYTDPLEVNINQAAHIFVTLIPSALATVTNVYVVYTAGSETGTNAMSVTTPNLYRTDVRLPAQSVPDLPVNFTVRVEFSGTNALSPASTSSVYTVHGIPFESHYETMQIIGDATADMTLVADNLWRGVITLPSPLASSSYQFRGAHTNGAVTNTWGDASPASGTLIVHGTAVTGATAIAAGPLPAGQIGFEFDAATGAYDINDVAFQNFNDWTGADVTATHESNGWIVVAGQIASDTRTRGRSAILATNNGARLRGPERPDGIGTISFWMRHGDESATPASEAEIQVSISGGSDAGEWVSVTNIPVATKTFHRREIPFNSRAYHYVRLIRTGTPAEILVDEFMVASPGSGVSLSNPTNTPSSPAASDTVSLSAEITALRGAALTNVTAWWRTAGTNAFTSIAMSNSTGDVWTTIADIPAGQGDAPDSLGAGDVEYYIRAEFDGYEAGSGSPAFLPAQGDADPIVFTIQPSSLVITNVAHIPASPEVGTLFEVHADLLSVADAVVTNSTLFYRLGTTGGFTEAAMTLSVSNTYAATGIPVPSHPGSPMQYYVRADFSGPSAQSPVIYPADGSNAPVTVLARAATPLSGFDTMTLNASDFTGTLRLIGDNRWLGLLTLPGPTPAPEFTIQGSGTNTVTWGDNSAAGSSLPVYGTAIAGQGPISLGGTFSNRFILVFNEDTGRYHLQTVRAQDFSDFTPSVSFTPGVAVVTNGWSIMNATVFNSPSSFDSNTLLLGGSAGAAATNSYVLSPSLEGGIGSIGFHYRNLDGTGSLPGRLDVQIRSAANTNWTTLAGVTNILTAEYLHFATPYTFATNTAASEVRILWTSAGNPTAAPIGIDDLYIETLGAYATVLAVTNSPASPTISDPVSISAEISAIHGASLTNVAAWWRTAGTNAFTGIAMLKGTGDTWTTSTGVPPAKGNAPDGLGAGNVEYYVHADFTGYQTGDGSPAFLPAAGSGTINTFTIQPARLVITNVIHSPASPAVGTVFAVNADLLAIAGAAVSQSTLYYRSGTTGAFSTAAMTLSVSNTYAATGIPVPAHPGSPVQYYIRTAFTGPSAQSPVFYPANGSNTPVTVLARAATPQSGFDTVTLPGSDFSGTIRLIGDNQWRGILTLPAPTLDPDFAIQGSGTNIVTWGDNSASGTNIPVFGTAVPGQTPIALSGTWSNHFILAFNDTTGLYSLRQAYLQNFSGFTPTNTFTLGAAVTNAGWTILNGTVFNTNGAFDSNTLRLGGPAATGAISYVQSPVISGGIGSIGFHYRNLDETGSRPGQIALHLRSAVNTNWVTIASITNILTAGYLFHETPYAFDASNIEVRLLWTSTNNPSESLIAVDDLTIERLSSCVAISNVMHAPPAPSYTNNVTISADITPTNAANLSATLWYRLGTSGTFTAAAITNTGGSAYITDPALPRTMPGTVQYYIAASFTSPQGDGPFVVTEPRGGSSAPLSFTNSDVLAAYTDFTTNEGWATTANTIATQTNNSDWMMSQGLIRATNFGTTPAGATWLNADRGPENFIQTPWIDLGVGVIEFNSKMQGTTPSATIEILVSTNGTFLETDPPIATLTLTNSAFETRAVPLNIEHGVIIRIRNTQSSAANVYLGIDNISVTYPLAKVAISNTTFHPYYPAATDPVHITCDISSATTFSPAFDITARVFYKLSTTTNWSGPIEMIGNGSHFITGSSIPAYPSGSRVNYYVQSTFKGYNRSYGGFNPATDPDNPNVSPHSYTTRTYASSYDTLQLEAGGATAGMSSIQDREWEGLLLFTAATNQPSFLFFGYGYYSGTNVGSGISTVWGDEPGTRTNLPISGVAEANGPRIVIPELAQGQYMIRFDEVTGQYSVQRVAFQDFDTWPASDTLFEESFNGTATKTYTQNFDTWNLSSLDPMTDSFEPGWSNIAVYPFTGAFPPSMEAVSPAGFYKIFDAVIVTQLIGRASLLIDTALSGEVRTTGPDSTGLFSFDARCASPNDFRPAIYNQITQTNVLVTASIQALDIPINSNTNSLGFAHKSILVNYVDANNYYELRMAQLNATQKRLEIWEKSGGTLANRVNQTTPITGTIATNDSFALLLFKNGPTNIIRAVRNGSTNGLPTFSDSSPLTPSTLIGLNGMDASLAVDSVTVHAVTNSLISFDDLLYSEDFGSGTASNWTDSAGAWTVNTNTGTYNRPGYTGPALSLDIDSSPDYVNWTTISNYANLAHSDYRSYIAYPQTASSVYMRVRHKNGNGHLIIDNIRSEAWRGETVTSNNWTATNAWVTTGQSGRGLELRGSRALATQNQFIQTPVISNGAAVIAFDYQSVTGNSNQLVFAIAYTKTNATASWFDMVIVTNNPTNWVSHSQSVDRELRPQIHRVGIFNRSTNAAAGILLDNIVITEPSPVGDFTWWCYNALVTDKQTTRRANLSNNIKGAYLNNSPTNGTGTNAGVAIAYTSYYPSVQSARLPDGIGEISFWYRAWDTNTTVIEIVAATNRYLPDAQWTTLDTLGVGSTNFTYYSKYFFDRDNRYVKLRINTGLGPRGRAAIDNVRISAPFASDLRMKNLKLVPEIPLFTDEVFVRVEVDDLFFSPSNIALRLYFKQGTDDWGQHVDPQYDLKPVETNGNAVVYQTISPIPARTIDTVIQYQVEATFDGFFTEGHSSPKRYSGFENPYHYWPVDLNHNQINQTPYYYTLSCLPGQVWINEFNVVDGILSDPGPQYIEIAGKGNTRIGNWRVEIINPGTYTTNASYTIPPGTVLGTASNSYGFFVLGDSNVPNRNITMPTNSLPESAGIQLVRSMGAFEYQVSYDPDSASPPGPGELMSLSPDHRFVYAGMEDTFWNAYPLSMIGSGSNSAGFSTNWATDTGDFSTIGTTNIGQTLIPWPDSTPDPGEETNYTGTAYIEKAWRVGTQVIMEITTQSANLTPKPWYTTNLMTSTWSPVPSSAWIAAPSPSWSRTGTTYNVTCNAITNLPKVFYAVTVTGTD